MWHCYLGVLGTSWHLIITQLSTEPRAVILSFLIKEAIKGLHKVTRRTNLTTAERLGNHSDGSPPPEPPFQTIQSVQSWPGSTEHVSTFDRFAFMGFRDSVRLSSWMMKMVRCVIRNSMRRISSGPWRGSELWSWNTIARQRTALSHAPFPKLAGAWLLWGQTPHHFTGSRVRSRNPLPGLRYNSKERQSFRIPFSSASALAGSDLLLTCCREE